VNHPESNGRWPCPNLFWPYGGKNIKGSYNQGPKQENLYKQYFIKRCKKPLLILSK
jgi:hypothetical protein